MTPRGRALVASQDLEPLTTSRALTGGAPRRRPPAFTIALLLGAALVAFAAIAATVAWGLPEDAAILAWLHAHSPSPLDATLRWVTYAGGLVVMVPVALAMLGALLRRGRRVDAWFLLAAIGGSEVLNLALKFVFQRDRPSEAWSTAASGYAFPSGHAMSSLAFYGALATIAWHSRWRRTVGAGAAVVVVLIGASRLTLGVHYPSDVIAGWCAGVAWLSALMLCRAPHRHVGRPPCASASGASMGSSSWNGGCASIGRPSRSGVPATSLSND